MKVLIFGLGLNGGGVGSAKFFAKQGSEVRVTDLKSAKILRPSLVQLKRFKNISYSLGGHNYEDIDWADLIIKNPAVKPENPYIKYALKSGKPVEMDIGIFLKFVKPSQIIGITGTKGKSTAASLIYQVLKRRKNMILAGNIGKSVLDVIPKIKTDSLVVLELSSFQLESFDTHKVSPKWAVITNIYPDHLNYYKDMDEYISAKKIIGKFQTKDDFLFIRKGDQIVDKPNFLKGLNGKIIRFSKDDLPKNYKPKLMGEHNLENMAASLAVARIFNITDAIAAKIIQNFKGIPCRMELIKTWHGMSKAPADAVKIINDTTATGPDAGIKALETASHMSSGNVILICGGMNKNMPYGEYIKAVNKYAKKVFFLEGDVTDLIRTSTPGVEVQTFGPYDDLEKLLIDIKEIVQSGDTILFSPAATSFNLFQNEFDRGRQFNSAVDKVFK